MWNLCIWYDSLMDLSVPMELLPEKFYDAFNNGDATVMAVFFDTSTSADETMEAITQIRQTTAGPMLCIRHVGYGNRPKGTVRAGGAYLCGPGGTVCHNRHDAVFGFLDSPFYLPGQHRYGHPLQPRQQLYAMEKFPTLPRL